MSDDYKARIEWVDKGNSVKYFLAHSNGQPMSYREVINSWVESERFRTYFTHVLGMAVFNNYTWETPPISNTTINRYFEFVLTKISADNRLPEGHVFEEFFTSDPIVTFRNLGNDALLIVPSPLGRYTDYRNLANFLRTSRPYQADALWVVLGKSIIEVLNDNPLWISVAGGGVAWLHIRIDRHPKYFRFLPYRNF